MKESVWMLQSGWYNPDKKMRTAKDYRLKDCEIIVSSPYTRALQSAAIISKELSIDIDTNIKNGEIIEYSDGDCK